MEDRIGVVDRILELNVTDLKIMEDGVGVVDRISELPDFIIHHIMSYLSSEKVVQMSVLSRRWNYLRISFPILVFNRWKMESSRERTDEFIRFVDASILRFCELQFPLQKFRLCMRVHDVEGVTSLLDKWIELAVAREVKELDFNVETFSDSDGDGDSIYSLPETLFSAKSVTTLKLRKCNLEQSSGTIRFQSLKKLVLYRVRIDEQVVQKFIRGCPLLEDLFLSSIWHFERVCVSPPKLKILTIDFSSSCSDVGIIEIVCPSLQQCTLSSLYVLSGYVIDMAGCYDLKYLDLTGADISDEDFHNFILKFPLLEKLILCDCTVEKIAFSSNRLRELGVYHCRMLISIDIDAPSLLTFSYGCLTYPASINIPRTCSLTARFLTEDSCNTLVLFDCIKEILEMPYKIEELSICFSFKVEDSFTLEEFKKCLPSLPHREVGNFIIDLLNVQPSKYATLLDCILWICHPRILSIEYRSKSSPAKEFIELFYKKIMNRDAECCNRHGNKKMMNWWFYKKLMNRDAECCNRHGIKCWQYYLRDFKIESFILFEDPKPRHIDNLMAVLPELESGTIQFHLDWCFS